MIRIVLFGVFALGAVGALIAGEIKLSQTAHYLRRMEFVRGQQAI